MHDLCALTDAVASVAASIRMAGGASPLRNGYSGGARNDVQQAEYTGAGAHAPSQYEEDSSVGDSVDLEGALAEETVATPLRYVLSVPCGEATVWVPDSHFSPRPCRMCAGPSPQRCPL